ncbi:hypothetical protein midi_01102 [Candidatus Midichloria mitochondrii IricVA]|uniref:Uncharacterized protein n=2 Tax=Candidatus Midichloria mitochondrii TaxID=234827 RepID=F7XU20_MIDMI|nr:hypothetical protein midi_01102 [Candidatus Midichloria mitochondrii IricVA]
MIDDSKDLAAQADMIVESIEQDSHYIVDIIISRLKRHYNILY